MEADRFKNMEMKEKLRKEYLRKIKKILKSEVNYGNIVTLIHEL